jgi:hypothetical protein
MENAIRSEMNESSQGRISSAEVLSVINAGQSEAATRGLCIEKDCLVTTIPGRNSIASVGVNVNYIEVIGVDYYCIFVDGDVVFTDAAVGWYRTTVVSSVGMGLQCILPTNIGYTPLNGNAPQKWFPWGKVIILEPVPDTRYVLKLYYSDYPADLVNPTDVPEVPTEFHRCIVDFAISALCIKLRRWSEVAAYYNRYINELQAARIVYIKKISDQRSAHEVPQAVKEVKVG